MVKKNFLKFLSLYKKEIFILFLLSLISSVFFLIGPYFSKLFIDKAFINKDFAKFLNLSIIGSSVFIVSTLVRVIGDVVKNKIDIRLKIKLSTQFIRKFYSLDLSFFQSGSVGENIYRLSDIGNVSNFLLDQCPNILVDIVKLPIILGISLWINVKMTIFLVILSPLFLLHSVYLQKKLQPIYEEIWKNSAKLSKEVYDVFSRILIIKAFGLESYQRRRYLKTLIQNMRCGVKSFRWTTVSSVSSSFLSKAIYGVISLYGGWLIVKGRITIGSYTAVMLYLTQLGGLLGSLANRFEYFARETVSLNRFFELIDIQPQIKDLPDARDLSSLKGEVKFKNVQFGYRKEMPILKGLNFTIPGSSWIAIVGPSGCGKTTLINMIARLYEPWQGEVLLDGLDLRKIKLKSLKDKIAISTQQPLLFDISIRENIGYGLKNVTRERIEEAAKISCVHDYIIGLPNGYDALIGEDACRLSQGLKQRIAIARAVIREPDLLILDEATSSIDSLTEEKIFQALKEKRQGLSTIVISHRLFSIKDADRIYFLRQDSKLEDGTHSELLSGSSQYSAFFHNQIEEVGNIELK